MGLFTRWQLSSRDPAARIRAAAALGASHKTAAVAPLVGLLADTEAEVRLAAVEALGAVGDPQAVDPVANVMRAGATSRDETAVPIRIAAVRALGRLGPVSFPALSDALRDRHPKVREAAVEALGSIGGPQAVPALATALRDERSQLRQTAARALAAIGGPDARAMLLACLDHKDPATRAAVVDALAGLGDAGSVGSLAGALGDREKAVRDRAVAALGKLGSSEAAEALLKAIEGPDRDLRQAAAAALRTLTWSPATPRQRALRAVVDGDYRAALAEGAEAVEPLLIALQEKDGRARRLAAEAIGATGDPRAVGPLVEVLGDHEDQVRSSAVEGLIRIGPAAAPAVIDALEAKSGPARAGASAVLAGIGEGPAVEPLFATLTTVRGTSSSSPRQAASRHGADVALLEPGEDVLHARRAVETLRTLLAHAAGRLPLPVLERAAGLRDLVESPLKDSRGGRTAGPPEEVSCAEVRELAHREIARRGRAV